MPDPVQPPGAEAPKKRRSTSGEAKIQELKQKYRLDTEVILNAKGTDGLRMGKGPVLDQQVFDRFAELDKTKNKVYLDWMLFQAGGGTEAFQHSRELWGDGTPEKTPEDFFKTFKTEKPDHVIHYDELRLAAQKFKDKGVDVGILVQLSLEQATASPNLNDRFNAVTRVLKKNNVAPGKEERIAADLVANKFKTWIKNQLATKVRDRVHATFIFNRMLRGVDRNEAEAKWKETEGKRRREYLFGDQDSLKWDAFGFNRHWPGRNNIYEQVFNQMRQFLINKERLERYAENLQAFNAKAAEKNKSLAPDQQVPLRQGIDISTNIGKVNVDADGNLTYKGPYPTVQSLAQANDQITELPMRERVTNDVRYAGPKGMRSKNARVYSDENLDVIAPLTVAASIQSGDPSWEISNPNQLSSISSKGSFSHGAWTKYATGQHGHQEWDKTQAIPVFFHLKVPGIPPDFQRLWLLVFLDDLVDLQPPYVATVWRTAGNQQKITFTGMMNQIKAKLAHNGDYQKIYVSIVRSIGNGMKAVREWGKEFNPQDLVGDYVTHHRERMQGKRTLGEQIKIRAHQIVDALLE